MYHNFFPTFVFSFLVSVILTFFVRHAALAFNVLDVPTGERKIHKKPTPLLGGWAIFLTVALSVGWLTVYTDLLSAWPKKYFVGIFLASLVIMAGGAIDDKLNLKARQQWIFPFVASLIIIASGIGINFITNPLGGVIRLDWLKITIISIKNIAYHITLPADLFTIMWLMGISYTTKFLDGLDGLVSGIGLVASIILFGISLLPEVSQIHTALLALILGGACLGFLIWNWHPAKIFLGEGGSIFIGFMLGVISIISGGKIATALLIMGIPILDVLWVIVRRFFIERESIFQADRKHLHFRLLDAGFTVRQSVGIFLLLSAAFGGLGIIFRGKDKVVLLLIMTAAMIILVSWVMKKYHLRVQIKN